jgi:serine/threonine protein kinase
MKKLNRRLSLILGKPSNRPRTSTLTENHVVSPPFDVKHRVHVDKEFRWDTLTGRESPEELFEIETQIGDGQFGAVYKAKHKESKFILAIKIVSVGENARENEIADEIEVLKSLHHECIVSYYGSCWSKTNLWILMDYCQFGSLKDIMENLAQTFNEDQIGYICFETLRGLVYLHSKQIIHRDVKAANILVTEAGQIKLGDFGLAQPLSKIKNNFLVGTPQYIPPEALMYQYYDHKSDTWSLGITAIELAEGVAPFSSLVELEKIKQAVFQQPPPTVSNKAKWSTFFISFLESCLMKNPIERLTPTQLLNNPFITKHSTTNSVVLKPIITSLSAKNTKQKKK